MKEKKKRVSKDEWLSKALEVFENKGIEGVRVEEIARQLNISKSGFYWHFKDRRDLMNQMLEYWVHEFTEVVIKNPELIGKPPKKRLELTMRLIRDYELNRLEAAMIIWANSDPVAKERLANVYKNRLVFLKGMFAEMGFQGDDLDMRVQLLLGYIISEFFLTKGQSKQKRNRLLKRRLSLLTSSDNS